MAEKNRKKDKVIKYVVLGLFLSASIVVILGAFLYVNLTQTEKDIKDKNDSLTTSNKKSDSLFNVAVLLGDKALLLVKSAEAAKEESEKSLQKMFIADSIRIEKEIRPIIRGAREIDSLFPQISDQMIFQSKILLDSITMENKRLLPLLEEINLLHRKRKVEK